MSYHMICSTTFPASTLLPRYLLALLSIELNLRTAPFIKQHILFIEHGMSNCYINSSVNTRIPQCNERIMTMIQDFHSNSLNIALLQQFICSTNHKNKSRKYVSHSCTFFLHHCKTMQIAQSCFHNLLTFDHLDYHLLQMVAHLHSDDVPELSPCHLMSPRPSPAWLQCPLPRQELGRLGLKVCQG